MFSSVHGVFGAGWCVISVFLVLLVRATFATSIATLSKLLFISASEFILSAQSSANKSLLRLIHSSLSGEALVNIAENIILNNVRMSTRPCFTSLATMNVR